MFACLGVLFLAATNRIDVLDSALLRPGRLSRKVLVPLPDEGGRRDILVVHMRGVPMMDESERLMSIDRMAAVTSGELDASDHCQRKEGLCFAQLLSSCPPFSLHA